MLSGWAFDITVLKSFYINSNATMKVNTAISFILVSVSLWLLRIKHANQWTNRISQGCAGIVSLIGFLTLVEYLSGWDIGIDQLLFQDYSGVFGISSPGRMSPVAALNFSLLGIALLFLNTKNRIYYRLVQISTSIVILSSFLLLLGYAYNIEPVYRITLSIGIAAPTAILFFTLSISILAIYTDRGGMILLTSASDGGRLIRHLLGATILILPFLGWLRFLGERKGIHNTEFGLSIEIICSVAIFVFLIWRGAIALDRKDTRHKQTEEQLHGATQRLKFHMENSPLAVIEWDSDYRITRWNDNAEVVFGWSSDEVMGKRIDELRWVYEEDWDKVRQIMADMLDGSRPNNVNKNRNYRKDGSVIHCEWYNSALFDTSGKLVSILSLILDVTDQKKAGEALKRSEEQYRLLFENNPNPMWIFDSETLAFVAVNEAAIYHYGYSREEFLSMTIKDIRPSEDIPELLTYLKQAQTGFCYIGEWRHRKKDNTLITVEAKRGTVTFNGKKSIFIMLHDITERKRIQNELKKYQEQLEELVRARTADLKASNEQLIQEIHDRKSVEEVLERERYFLKTILDTIDVGVVACDSHGAPVILNRTSQQFHGLSEEPKDHILFEQWPEYCDLYMPNGITKIESEKVPLFRALKGEKFHNVEVMIIPKHSIARVLLVSGQALIDRYGKTFGAVIVAHDITERKRAEDALRASENKYRLLVDNLPQRIFYKDKNLSYVSCNKVAARDFHIRPDDIYGKTDYDLFPKGVADKYRAEDTRIMESGKGKNLDEFAIIEGKEFILHTVKTPIKDEQGNTIGILSCSLDITEKIALQKEAEQSRHLASLGELAAGVGHEINNPITGVINCAQILFNKSQEGSRERDIASRIIRDGDRVARIVHSLLSFARPSSKEKRGIASINEILSDTLTLIEAQLRKDGIRLKTNNISQGLPQVIGNEQLIQQIFLNAINNARYALNQKYPGTHDNKILEISAEEVMIDNSPSLQIVFHDHGTGIPAGIRDKVMNPFFTTKPTGKGTGLGLSISHSIIRDHGGKLLIDSVEGEFTRVSVILPVRNE